MLPEYLEYFLLTSLAIAPAVAIIIFIYLRDKYEKEPMHLLVKSFFLGCLSVLPALALQTLASKLGLNPVREDPFRTFSYAIYVVGFTEEFSKFIFLRGFAYRRREFNEPFDGIMYSVMIGMGFATVENLIYVTTQVDFQQGLAAGLARTFTAVPAHACFAIVMGYYAGLAKFRPERRGSWLLMGLLCAVILHGCYDFFLIQHASTLLGFGAFFALIYAISLSHKAIKLHTDDSPFRPLPSKRIAPLPGGKDGAV